MIPTVIIPVIDNEHKRKYMALAERARQSVLSQTVEAPVIVALGATLSEARNLGVESAETEYCMNLDADDVIHHEFIEHVNRVKDWDIIKPRVYVNGLLNALPERDIRQMNFLINGCPFRRSMWLDVGGQEEVPYPDWHVWAKIIIKHDPKIVYVREAVYHYLQSDEGLNRNRTQEDMAEILSLVNALT